MMAGLTIGGYALHVTDTAKSPAPHTTAAVQTTIIPTSSSPTSMTLGGDKDVDYRVEDTAAADFLSLSLSCGGPWSASLADFLDFRIQQQREFGIRGSHYSVISDTDQGRPIIIVDETTGTISGKPLGGIPERVDYEYWMDESTPRYAGAAPAWARAQDPLSFFQEHIDAVCNQMVVTGRIVLPRPVSAPRLPLPDPAPEEDTTFHLAIEAQQPPPPAPQPSAPVTSTVTDDSPPPTVTDAPTASAENNNGDKRDRP
jgi:hypothetical protein